MAVKGSLFSLLPRLEDPTTNVPGWLNQTDWLSYEKRECTWFAQWLLWDRATVVANLNVVELAEYNNVDICTTEGAYQQLRLYINKLQGTIPREVALLTSLQTFLFFVNSLEGTIPAELSNLSNLELLSLAGNQLTGSIPSEVGILSSLKFLALLNNRIEGSIPSQLGLMPKLELLLIADNQLSSTIH